MATLPYTATWVGGNGNWSDAADWDETEPTTEHVLPGVDDAVVISSPNTVTFDTTAAIWSLNGTGWLDMTGGSLTLDHQSSFNDIELGSAAASLTLANGATLDVGVASSGGGLASYGSMLVDAGATFLGGYAAYSGSTTVNNGALEVIDGTIGGTFTNNGTLTLETDVSEGGGGTYIAGVAALGGAIDGGAALFFVNGASATISTSQVTVGAMSIGANSNVGATTVRLETNLTYSGKFSLNDDYNTPVNLDLDGYTLTLGGFNPDELLGGEVDGPGALKVTGTTDLGNLTVGGTTYGGNGTAATLEDAGTIYQTGSLSLHGELLIDSGTVFVFTDPSEIYESSATIINNGTLDSTSGGTVSGGVTNNKLLEANGAFLDIDGAVTGTGSAEILGGGTLAFGGAFQQNVAFTGAGALALSQAYSGVISGFVAGDSVDLTTLVYKSSYQAVWGSPSGTLEIVDAADAGAIVATLDLAGLPASLPSGETIWLSQDNGTGTNVGLQQKTVNANGGYDIHDYGLRGVFQGVVYTSYDDAYTSSGFLDLTTYYSATGSVVASESFTSNGGYSINVGGVLTQQKTVNANGSYDIAYYGSGAFQGVSYTSYQDAYTSVGFLDLVTYYGSTGAAAASESFTSNGGYAITVGGIVTQEKSVNADGSYDIAYSDVTGQTYSAYEDVYSSVGTKVAEARNDTNGTGSLILYGDGLTVASSATGASVQTGTDVFVFTPHFSTEAITATGTNDETLIFAAGFGKDAISGFTATTTSHDVLQFSKSMFSYLTSGMTQAQDLAAVLAHATGGAGFGNSNISIPDSHGDILTLDAVSKSTLMANAADFKFV